MKISESGKTVESYLLEIHLRQPVCGDGVLDSDEICDDGNTEDGDGCDSNCIVESDGHCQSAFVTGNELYEYYKVRTSNCEHGYDTWSGFGDSCDYPAVIYNNEGTYEFGNVNERWTAKHKLSSCYSYSTTADAVLKFTVDPDELLEINSNKGLRLKLMVGRCGEYNCDYDTSKISYVNNNSEPVDVYLIAKGHYVQSNRYDTIDKLIITYKKSQYSGFCGDGKYNSLYKDDRFEACDDGNNIDGDGCSSDCLVEKYWSCDSQEGARSKCRVSDSSLPRKGWGISKSDSNFYMVGLYCNDGNTVAGDGCYNFRVEKGWSCWTGDLSVRGVYVDCYNLCGNGVVNILTDEICDDGNNIDGDGCDRNCQLEPGYYCNGRKCYLRDAVDLAHSGNTKDDAFTFENDKVRTVFDALTEDTNEYTDNYQLDASCEGYNKDNTTGLRDVIYKIDLSAGQLAAVKFVSGSGNYTVNFVREFSSDGQVSCYRKDANKAYFATVDQTLYIILEEKESNLDNPKSAELLLEKYEPACGDGIIDGYEECDTGIPILQNICTSSCTIDRTYAYKGCFAYTDANNNNKSQCFDNVGFTGYPMTCGGAALYDESRTDVTMNFSKIINGVSKYPVNNRYGTWKPDLVSCTVQPEQNKSQYYFQQMIIRYNVKAGDKLSFSGDKDDYFYVIDGDCWHGQCLDSFKYYGSWTSIEDRQVWVIMDPHSNSGISPTVNYVPAQ